MIRSTFSKVLLGFSLIQASLWVGGCSSDPSHQGEVATTGTFSLPLLTTVGAHTYRLQGGLYISGPSFISLDINADSPTVSTTLPTGSYYAYLYTWTLTRDDGTGRFEPVDATLVSSSSPSFAIFNQTTTTIVFQFQTDGQIITIGSGQLNVAVSVTETPPVCAPLGSDCAPGSWCAPPELTGERLRCIAEGPVAPGATCASPQDCAANSSCFDLGAGPICVPLCARADFNQACGSGGTCTPKGAEYGLCLPGAPDTDGGAGDGGSTNLALNNAASATSEELNAIHNNIAPHANDGDLSTRWTASDGSLPQTWQVDLAAPHSLTGVNIAWESSAAPYQYTVEVSSDNVSWSLVDDQTANTTAHAADLFATTAIGRYVRLTVTGVPLGQWASAFEISVLGF